MSFVGSVFVQGACLRSSQIYAIEIHGFVCYPLYVIQILGYVLLRVGNVVGGRRLMSLWVCLN